MKDLYSFSKTEEEFKDFYEKCAEAYIKIFTRVGIGDMTYRTIATGGSFTTNLTDEFQTISPAGEDIIYITDENMDILFVNVKAAKQAGYTRGELIGANVSILVPERFLMEHRAGVQAINDAKLTHSANVDCWLVTKDKQEIPVAVAFDLCVLNEEMIYVARTPDREPEEVQSL